MTDIKIKRQADDVIIPHRGRMQDAGYDIHAYLRDVAVSYIGNCPALAQVHEYDLEIQPHTTEMVHTGFHIEIPDGYFGAIVARSGLASKQGLRLAQGFAVIDSNYRGEVMVPLHNDTDTHKVIKHQDRIAQLLIMPVPDTQFIEVNELSDTERGSGGFGSSGT